MRKQQFSFITVSFISGLLVMPSLIFYNLKSLSYGTIIMSLLLILYFILIHKKFLLNTKYLLKNSIESLKNRYFIFFCLILFHFLITSLVHDKVNFNRFFLSYFCLVLFILSSFIFSLILINNYQSNKFEKSLTIIFYFILFLSFLIFLRFSALSPLYYKTNIYLTIYAEPSHFVMSILPFILYFLISQKSDNNKAFIFLFFLIISLLAKSAMLLVSILFFGLLSLSRKSILLILILIITSILYLFLFEVSIDINYFIDRFSLDSKILSSKPNMSVLVYLANYHETYLNFINTFFLGIGFQQFGFVGETSYFRELIYDSSGYFAYSHNKDASFLIGKILSEFGILGLFFLFFYYRCSLISFILIKQKNKIKKYYELKVFFSSCILAYLIELIIRGAGYFTLGTLLFFTGIFGLNLLYNYEKNY